MNNKYRWLIAAGEGRSLLAASAAHFCLLGGYYMLRSLREALALDAGRSQFANLFTLTMFASMALLPAYWWLVARLPRRLLFPVAYSGVIVLFLGFALAIALRPGQPLIAAAYFVALTTLNLFVVSVFWSVMVDVWRSESAKRLFGFIAAGGSLGALAGPAFNALFVEQLGLAVIIVIACAMLGGAIVLGMYAQRTRAEDDRRHVASPAIAVGGRAFDDLKRLLTSRYLLVLALVIIIGQIVAAFMYNEQARIVEAAFVDRGARAALFARLDFGVSALSLLLQFGVVGVLTLQRCLVLRQTIGQRLRARSVVRRHHVRVLAVLLAVRSVLRAVSSE